MSHYTKNLLYGLASSGFIAALYVVAAMRFPFDYPWHADAGERLLNGIGEVSPHFLWHALLIFIYKVLGGSFMAASFIGVFLCVFAASLVVYRNFSVEVGLSSGIFVALSISVLFVHPVFLAYPFDGRLYLGYFAPNAFHNPTLILLKPIALLHFILLCVALKNDGTAYLKVASYLLLGVLLALSAIAKPSYIVMLVPSVVLVILANIVFRKYFALSVKRVILIGCTLLPGLAVLIWQYLHFFVEGGRGASIGIEFLGTYEIYSAPWTFPLKLVGSIIFPLSLVFVMGRKLTRKIDFQLSAVMLLVSMFYAYFIVELYAGEISGHGNWWWSSQLANFLLFFVCARYYLIEVYKVGYWRLDSYSFRILLPGLCLILHFVAGVIWYIANVFPNAIHPFGNNLIA